jgi:hypothetical protein
VKEMETETQAYFPTASEVSESEKRFVLMRLFHLYFCFIGLVVFLLFGLIVCCNRSSHGLEVVFVQAGLCP